MSATSADVADLVREHPDLTPAEKETTIRFAKGDERATVATSAPPSTPPRPASPAASSLTPTPT
jgi:hypothetical protein